jgi:predicted subunit of tRNA(5-methylaminomethyl-2-thiouridylate) methyltransferase
MPFIVFVMIEYIARAFDRTKDGKTRQDKDPRIQRAAVWQQEICQGREAQAPQAKVSAIIFSVGACPVDLLQV